MRYTALQLSSNGGGCIATIDMGPGSLVDGEAAWSLTVAEAFIWGPML